MTRWAICNVCEDDWDEDEPQGRGVHIEHPVKPFSLCHGCYEAVIEHSWRLHARYAQGEPGRAPLDKPKEAP